MRVAWAKVVESGLDDVCGVAEDTNLWACCLTPPAYGFTTPGSSFHGVTCARHAILLRELGHADRLWTLAA